MILLIKKYFAPMVKVTMKYAYTWYQGLILITASIIFNSACAVDNPDTPNLISKFKVDEKVY